MKRLLMIAVLLLQASGLWALASLGSITLTEVKCRILTPNGDGLNDKARFELDNPEQLPVTGTIFDLSGARVGTIQQGLTPDVVLWDGKSEDGQTVAGGVYIYQLEFHGKFATGMVTVAR